MKSLKVIFNKNKVTVPGRSLPAFCRKNHVKKMGIFGSILTDRFRSDSDVDVLVEFESGKAPGYFGMARLERELSKMLGGRKVDLRTPAELSRYFRNQVLKSAEYVYGRA